ncbi:unnamed protein product [Allacma fusca]|uniref:carnitine O-palmitoyltransferase n=1 Tax=Allacma fusca TaxID=39272 RepID=A0A8J2LG87_9HEXA|nr:unnamed protein product [Allacma fusca]
MLKKIYGSHRHYLIFGYYPSSLFSAVTFLIVALSAGSVGLDLTFGLSGYIESLFNGDTSAEGNLTCFLIAIGLTWIGACTLRKYILRRLLQYKGFIYEPRKPSLKTKLVIGSIRLLHGWSKPLTKSLYGCQGILPLLPIPNLQDSVNQYLESMKPLVDKEKHEILGRLADEFVKTNGPTCQRYLVFKSWLTPNYISDWWEKYIYLMGRSSILINSNYYCFDALECPTSNQATRAALLTYSSLKIRQQIEDNKFEPIIIQDAIPLCSWQYERIFNTCRIPGETVDTIQHEDFSDYVVVQHRGRYFKIRAYHPNGNILSEAEFQLQFNRILKDESHPAVGEMKLGALTTWDRINWAKTRANFFSKGVNKQSLDFIEKSAFIINLDDQDFFTEHTEKDTTNLDHFARALFHGKGYDRWIDKSVNVIIGKNGRAGVHCEHSLADGPVGSHIWEINLRYALDYDNYDDQGCIAASVGTIPPYPDRLTWDLPQDCLEAVDQAALNAQKLIDNVGLKMVAFSSFGRSLMKKCQVSPDAFIQMALQLAFFRLQDQIKYFQKACDRHQNTYRNAMSGSGCDRHLFGLYAVSKYLKIDSPFLNEALSRPWLLSTSQTSMAQTKLKPTLCPGGGFGPVSEDGYGVSYIFCGETSLFFHVTSNKASVRTDSVKFAEEITRALNDIRAMFSL